MNRSLLHSASFFAIFFVASIAGSSAATAQSDGVYYDVPVLKEAQPMDIDDRYDLMRYSDFTVSTDAQVSTLYNDNVYRTKDNTSSDFITEFSPTFRGQSRWDQHELGFRAAADFGLYTDETDLNYTDFDFSVFGRYDFSDMIRARIGAQYRYDHSSVGEDPDQPDTSLAEPPIYKNLVFNAGLDGQLSHKYSYDFDLRSIIYDFDNTRRRDGNISIYDDKDRTEYKALMTLNYLISPTYTLYGQLGVNMINYDKRIDSTLLYNHDANGQLFMLGLKRQEQYYNWDIAAGYRGQDYDSNVFKDTNIFDVRANLNMRLDIATDVDLYLHRDIRESSSTGVSSYISSRIGGQIDHRFSHSWSSSAGMRYTINDFQTNTRLNPIDREDKLFEPHAEIRYHINDNALIGLEYRYQDRSSNDSSVEYDANMIGLRFKYSP